MSAKHLFIIGSMLIPCLLSARALPTATVEPDPKTIEDFVQLYDDLLKKLDQLRKELLSSAELMGPEVLRDLSLSVQEIAEQLETVIPTTSIIKIAVEMRRIQRRLRADPQSKRLRLMIKERLRYETRLLREEIINYREKERRKLKLVTDKEIPALVPF